MTSIARHRMAVLTLTAVVSVCAVTAPVGAAAASQGRDEAEDQELVSLAKIVGAALLGQIIPTDEPFGWANDYWKGTERTTFVPFTLTVDQAKLSTPRVAMFVVAVRRGGSTAAAPDAAGSTLPPLAFEDAFHVDLGAPNTDGDYELRRAFYAPAGDYDVFVALSESGVPDGTEARTMMLKQAVSVPDLWSGGLTTSRVMLLDRIEQLSAPLPPDQALANPYTLATTRLVPRLDRTFLSSEELSTYFVIYDAALTSTGMPDVTAEYNFYTTPQAGGNDEFFNTSGTQTFNAQTLPQSLDFSAGAQLAGGQVVPLAEFPAGDYRLEIKVIDNTNGASLTRNLDFSVSAS